MTVTGLKSWKELLETALTAPEESPDSVEPMIYCETPISGDFPSSGVSHDDPMRNPCETPEKLQEERPRLVRTGPTTWVEEEESLSLCVFCQQDMIPGDVICCAEHRVLLDATPFEPQR